MCGLILAIGLASAAHAQPFDAQPDPLPSAQIGTFYSETITLSGGIGDYNVVNVLAVPAGLAISPALPALVPNGGTLTVSGTPAQIGNFVLEIYAFDTGAGEVNAGVFLEVGKAETETAVVSSANPSPLGDDVTFTATVTSAFNPPTGDVTFVLDGNPVTTVPLGGGGTATYTASGLSEGIHVVEAWFEGGESHLDSYGYEIQFVGALDTMTELSSSANPSTTGTPVTFTAELFPCGCGTPTGNVVFSIDGTPEATVPLAGSLATFTRTFDAARDYQVTAAYQGDGSFNASSADLVQTIEAGASNVTLASSANPSIVGDIVTFTATVAQSGSVAPSGIIEFLSDGVPIGISDVFDGEGFVTTEFLTPGARTITAVYRGDPNYLTGTATLLQGVGAASTLVTLTSSLNPASLGDAVTFTAQVDSTSGPGTPTGNVVFSIGGAQQPPVALSDGTARFSTSTLPAGTTSVVASYAGDAGHTASASAPLSQQIIASGTVFIRQLAQGGDATFGFASATPSLNLAIATSGGSGQSSGISLGAGTYAVTADDMTALGYATTAIVCSDGDSTGSVATRTAAITLAAGETVTCTFTSLNTLDETTSQIAEFLETRAHLMLTYQTDLQRRIDRLNGVQPSANPVADLMSLLPGTASLSTLTASTSLAQLDAIAGDRQARRFDIWFEGVFARADTARASGDFARATIGVDYLFSRNLLVGAFAQIDHLTMVNTGAPGRVSGTGWLAGPYLTARLSERLYFDLLAGVGTSSNRISPFGTYTDPFTTTRALVSARLQGDWKSGAWTFTPGAGLAWFGERSRAYTDSLGVPIPAVTSSVAQFHLGPAFSYRFQLGDGAALETGLKAEAVAEWRNTLAARGFDNIHGRVEGSLRLRTAGGASGSLSVTYSGIGAAAKTRSLGARVRLSVPIR